MKILLLTTHLNLGGIGVYTLNLAKYLKKSGLDVIVASSGGDLEDRFLAEDIRLIDLNIKTKAEFGLKMWKALPRLKKIVRDNKIDLVHSQTRVAQVLAHFLKKSTGMPYVTTCHGFFNYLKMGRKMLPAWGDRAIAISKSVQEHLVEDLGVREEDTELVYNGIEIDRFLDVDQGKKQFIADAFGLDSNKVIIGSVGRLSSVKGYKYLIEAFSQVVVKSDAQLLLVGDGPERKALLKQIAKLGLRDRVFLDPGGRNMDGYLSLIDIFCLPSIHEGLGLSLMEAMAAGRACVASDVGGLSELIENGKDGVLVPSEDPIALRDAVLGLVDNPELREYYSRMAREKAIRNFSMEECAAKTIAVYRSVLEKLAAH